MLKGFLCVRRAVLASKATQSNSKVMSSKKKKLKSKSKVAHNGASTFDLTELSASLRPVRLLCACVFGVAAVV